MGKDKSELNYHGKPQKEFLKKLLEQEGLKTYYSVQTNNNKDDEIHDSFLNLGPFGGFVRHFKKTPTQLG
jgi:hypothetical protein